VSTPLPGQRAAQRPMQAATASQRAIGRAVTATGGVVETLILNVGGEWRRVATDPETGSESLVPYELGQDETEE